MKRLLGHILLLTMAGALLALGVRWSRMMAGVPQDACAGLSTTPEIQPDGSFYVECIPPGARIEIPLTLPMPSYGPPPPGDQDI